MLPKRGKLLPAGRTGSATRYVEIIALALKTELGDTHRAVKTVRRWTGASERTVKNWFAGSVGPRGDYLLEILRNSEVALEMILAASRRFEVLEFLLESTRHHAEPRHAESTLRGDRASRGLRPRERFHAVPDLGPDPDLDDPEPTHALNTRQCWFLGQLKDGHAVTAGSVERQFGVSRKTAKRDIAGLKRRGVLRFVGSRRTGRYRLGPNPV